MMATATTTTRKVGSKASKRFRDGGGNLEDTPMADNPTTPLATGVKNPAMSEAPPIIVTTPAKHGPRVRVLAER
jgi:hypothetical protein